jgi:transcriptional antiterminator RfaH
MQGKSVWDTPNWFAVYTHPQQESRAENNLNYWGVETFNPRIRKCRSNPFTSRPSYVVRNFFSRYIFARFNAGEMFRKVCLTRGIHSVVSFGGTPVPVDEEIISVIKSRTDKDGFVRMCDRLEPGDRVVVSDGAFRDFVGVFDHEIEHADRVMILLTTIKYQGSLVVGRESIRRAVG